MQSVENGEKKGFESGMVGVGGVEVGADAIAAGETSGVHEGAGEEVRLLHFIGVEEDLEADGVEKSDDFGVSGVERAGRRIDPEDGGAVLLYSGPEELLLPLPVVVVQPVLYRPEKG